MKRLPIFLLLGAVVFSSLVVGCRDENDPEYWLDYMYDRPWREKSLKTLNEIFNKAMQDNQSDVNSPAVKKLVDLMVPELIKGYKEFTRDKFNRTEIIKLLAQMKDPRAGEIFLDGLSSAEPGDSLTFQTAANAAARLGLEPAIGPILAAHQKIVTDRSRRPGATFTVSENEIEQAVISSLQTLLIKHPNTSQKSAVVKVLCDISETWDDLQELRLNMKALKALGKIGDPAAIPTLIKGIAFKGRRQPIGLGQIAFASLQQIPDRDKVVDAVLAFAKREDKSFNAFFKDELAMDPLMKNPTWYLQQAEVFFGMLNYPSPKVVEFLTAELNHTEPDALDEETAKMELQIQFEATGWAAMRRNWAAVALAELQQKSALPIIAARLNGKDKLQPEEMVGYVRAMGLLLYPDESCGTLLKVAKEGDDSLRDKAYYNASLMCGKDFLTAIEKSISKIDCEKIVAERFPGESGTQEEKDGARNECNIMKNRLIEYADRIKFGMKCGQDVACYGKELESAKGNQKDRALYGLYMIARDNPGKKEEIIKLLIKNLDTPNKSAILTTASVLDKLTPNGGKELEAAIETVYKKIRASYKAEARELESVMGRIHARSRK